MPVQPIRLGSLQLSSRYFLAPLAGYTNLSFRTAVRELGGLGLATTDLVNARALLQFSRKTMELLQTCPEDRPVAVQIYGSEAPYMAEAARWLENYGVSSIDINMGCPVHKVTRGGGGSAMMCDAGGTVQTCPRGGRSGAAAGDGEDASGLGRRQPLGAVLRARVRASRRRRRDGPRPHARQGFGGRVNHDGIRAVVEAVERHPSDRQRRRAHHRRRRPYAEHDGLRRPRHWAWGAAQSVVLRSVDALGRDRRSGTAGDILATLALHEPAFSLAGRPSRRAICLFVVP